MRPGWSGRCGRRAPAPALTYRIDPAYFEQRGLLYLSVDELTRLRDRLYDYQEFIESYAAHPTLARLLEALNQQIANAMALGFLDLGLGGGTGGGPAIPESLIDQVSARLDGATTYVSPWAAAFSLGRFDEPDAGYFFSADRRMLFLFVRQERDAGNFAENRGTIEAIRGTIARLQREYPGRPGGRDGGAGHLERRDGHGLRRQQAGHAPGLRRHRCSSWRPSGAWSSPSSCWRPGREPGLVDGNHHPRRRPPQHLLGDVHLHRGGYRHRLRHLLPLPLRGGARRAASQAEALRRAAERAGPGMLLGALTAAGAFFVLMLTKFRGIAEFGFVSGTAILLAFLSMLTLFPRCWPWWIAGRSPAAPGVPAAGEMWSRRWLERIVQYRKTILALTAS